LAAAIDIDIPPASVITATGADVLDYFQNEPYFDMASVEVLRGPRALAGKERSGGAVFFRAGRHAGVQF
jgi:hypothetical protein